MAKTPKELTDEELLDKAEARTLTKEEFLEYLVRLRGMEERDALYLANGSWKPPADMGPAARE